MFYRFVIALLNVVTSILFNVNYEGIENIPTDQGFILASNHRSYYDPIFNVIRLPKPMQMSFMAKSELFKNKIFGFIIKNLNAFPVQRGKGDTDALDRAYELLAEGKPLLVYPEGSRSKDGKPGRPRSGAALIAGRARVGILPCSIDYGKKLSFRAKVVVKFHPLITSEKLGIDLDAPRTIRNASREVMDVIVSGLHHIPAEEANS